MNKSAPPTAALPCPFCGIIPPFDATQGMIVHLRGDGKCALSAHEFLPSEWNRRAPAVQATADADELAREIWEKMRHLPVTYDATGDIAAIIRKAVSPKAAQEEPVDPKDIPTLAEIRELLSGESAAVSGDKQEKERG